MTGRLGPPLGFGDLPGFEIDDHGAAFAVFHRHAVAAAQRRPALRPALPASDGLRDAERRALALGPCPTAEEARRFFTESFVPRRIDQEAFFTGYYEPVVDGSPTRDAAFTAPLLARPDDLKTFAAGEARPAWAQDLTAAQMTAGNCLVPYPTRAAIEAAIEGGDTYRPLVWLRDWTEVFLIQVQGSARVRLPDGTMMRITYAGRNGHPYTSIGRLLVESGAIAADAMSLARLKAWVRANGQAPGEAGRALLQRNASYIFFTATPDTTQEGPTGGAGVPLTASRSIAVDRALWCYGLPFWVDAALPLESAAAAPVRRLTIAQDTGSAIVGPARVDWFVGSGDDAGTIAGRIRHHGTLVVLLPRQDGEGVA